MELSESLTHMLHRASQAGDQMFALESQALALTARQYAVLQAVAQNPGCTQAKIVTATGVDRSTLSDLLTRLQAKGLVTRERSFADARSHIVRLTAVGETSLEAARMAANKADRRLTDILGEAETQRLLASLALIAAQAQQNETVPTPSSGKPAP